MNSLTSDTPEIHNSWKHWITKDTTLRVPEDFGSIEAVSSFLSDKLWPTDVTVYIDVADGIYTPSANELASNKVELNTSNQSVLKGRTTIEKTISAFVSATGSAGNWDVILTLNNLTGLTVGKFVNIYDLAGTGDPEAVGGCLEITNLSGSNITVKSLHKAGTFPTLTITSGVLDANLTSFEQLAIFVNSNVTVTRINVINDLSNSIGITVSKSNNSLNLSYVGFAKQTYGIFSSNHISYISLGVGVCFSGHYSGIVTGNVAFYGNPSITGCTNGIVSTTNAGFYGITNSVAGNTIDFYASKKGLIILPQDYTSTRALSPAWQVSGNDDGLITD